MITPFAAMRYVGVSRDTLRKLNKADRIQMWMMIVMTVELSKAEY